MDVQALRNMVNNLNPDRKPNPHRNLWFKPDTTPTTVRVLPYPHGESDIPFFEVHFHYGVGGVRSQVCNKHYDGSPCDICDLADEFRAASGGNGKDDPNFKIFLDLKAKPRIYAPVLVRGKEDEGVKLWGFPNSILQYFVEKAADPDWGDFTHPINGRDVSVQILPKHSQANNSSFDRPSADLKPTTSPVFQDKDQIRELLESIPNFFELDPPCFPFKTQEEVRDCVLKLQSENDGEDVDTDLPYAGSKTTQTNTTSDSLKSKLDSLLD